MFNRDVSISYKFCIYNFKRDISNLKRDICILNKRYLYLFRNREISDFHRDISILIQISLFLIEKSLFFKRNISIYIEDRYISISQQRYLYLK